MRNRSMSYIKTLFSRYPSPLLKPSINPNEFVKSHPILKSWSDFYSTQIPDSVSNPTKPQKSRKKKKLVIKNKRPLDIVFKEALGLCEKEETLGNLIEENDENGELKKKLWELEMEIRQLKAASSSLSSKEENVGTLEALERKVKGKDGEDEGFSEANPKTLATLFGSDVKEGGSSVGMGKGVVFKEISQDMQLLLRHLYDRDYFKDVNFLPGNKFDMTCFYEEYAREYVKYAIMRFGHDNKEISKWLSGSDAKSVAVFGCPSVNKKDVFSAKALRSFFKIQEETVCSRCILKDSCSYVNRSAGKGDGEALRLDSLLRLLRAYSMEEISPQLKITDDVKACVSRLIHEVMSLSKGVDDAASDGSGELASGR